MTHPDHLEHLLDPATFKDEVTLAAIAVFAQKSADGLHDIARSLQPDDPRRPALLANAQGWHQLGRTASQLADEPFVAAIGILREAGMLDDPT